MTITPPRNTPRDDSSEALRAELALALDGEAEQADESTVAAYTCAATLLGPRFARVIDILQFIGPERVIVAGCQFDPLYRLMALADVEVTRVDSLHDLVSVPAVVVIGCISPHASDVFQRIPELLDAGSIFVTSDKCAALPGLDRVLRPGAPQPPRRARLRLNAERAAQTPQTAVVDPLSGLLPAIRLAPGHVPVAPAFERDDASWVLASEHETSAPLVVSIAAGRGHLVHAVPHWWQDATIFETDLERRSIADMPGLRHAATDEVVTSFGQFSAAWGMLAGLVSGLELAFERSRRDDIRSGWIG